MELVEKKCLKDVVGNVVARLEAADAPAGGKGDAADGDLRQRIEGADGAGAAKAKAKAANRGMADAPDGAPDDDDSRTLWVDVDGHGLRRKSFENAVLESYAVPYGESSRIRGPPTTMHVLQYLFKNGGDPRLWLELFRQLKNMSRTDRI